MTKLLTFANGTTIEVLESSTIYNVIIIFTDPLDMIRVWNLFTYENLTHGRIGDDEFTDIVPLDLDAIKDDGLIVARFESRDKTEIEKVKEEMSQYFNPR